MATEFRLRLAEFCLWVAAATAGIVLVLGFVAVLVDGGLVALKFYLFLVGVLLFGVGSLAIQPKRPSRNEQLVSVESDEATRFEELISDVPPLESRDVPMGDRFSRDVKLFTTGVALLAVSFAMEVVFGVTPA